MARNNCLAVVYAKGHSERVPGKNMRDLGGLPLFWHITKTAKRQAWIGIDRLVVDTDCPKIADYARCGGVEVVSRPDALTQPEATGDDLVYHTAVSFPRYEVILQLYPTSPFVDEDQPHRP